VSNEIADRAWGVQIIKDTVTDELGHWPDDEEDDVTPARITDHNNKKQH
jgi:hypothetical protein